MLIEILLAGLSALKDYIAKHVLTCLVPAFLLAGALVSFVDRNAILATLGERAGKLKSFSLASLSSFFLAACSCTVIPVASGLYYGGAGVGVAFIILWVAPASNILSLMYTGSILGTSMVLSRVGAALAMALVVGWVMTLAFAREREALAMADDHNPGGVPRAHSLVGRKELWLLLLILLSLLMPNYLVRKGPYSAKVLIWFLLTVVTGVYAWETLDRDRIRSWMTETWFFVRIIFPLLLLGVFLVGVIGKVLPPEWIHRWLGGNSLRASFLATMLGSVSYFATLTEAPFVDTLLHLGMGKGPALALLLTGPGLSLPNWLAIARVFGIKKALVYVPTVIVLGTAVGFVFGKLIF
ncbi:MAG: permease [candidate division KSB1 bacterium]|nr:permease [candidate division KSB1 bacterium]